VKMRKEIHKGEKKYADKLSRFRNDVRTFSEQFGGVKKTKKGFKAPITRKEKRKLERKLKHAKNLAFTKKEKVNTIYIFLLQCHLICLSFLNTDAYIRKLNSTEKEII